MLSDCPSERGSFCPLNICFKTKRQILFKTKYVKISSEHRNLNVQILWFNNCQISYFMNESSLEEITEGKQ